MSDRAKQDNAWVLAVNSVCDGYKMLWRDLDQDKLTQRIERLQSIVYHETDTDPAEMSRHIKVKVLRSSGERAGGLVAVQVTGEAARSFGHLPWSWAFSLSQVHFKTWADEVYLGATDGFADAMFRSEGLGQLSFFSAKKDGKNKKDGGSKGTRVGSRKSDVHTIVYKRQRERTGIETRVQDKALNRIVGEVDLSDANPDEPLRDAQKMGALHRRAAIHGFRMFLRELRRRGVCLTSYFRTVAPFAQGAYEVTGLNELDHNEESEATLTM